MSFLFAFWAVDSHGRPRDAHAHNPWGEPSALDALEALEAWPDEAGPWLTALDAATETLVWAGDASSALRAFAAEVFARTGDEPDPTATATDEALRACRAIAQESNDEWMREAVLEWRYPDPETERLGPLPAAARRSIRDRAEAVGREHADHALCSALTALATPARLAA